MIIHKKDGDAEVVVANARGFGDRDVEVMRIAANGAVSFSTTVDLPAGTVVAADVEDASISAAKLASSSVTTAKIAALAVTKAKALVFISSEQTATGVAQNVAHGLASTPALVLISPSVGTDGAGSTGTQMPTIAYGTHTSTNVVCTVSAGAKFYVMAWA